MKCSKYFTHSLTSFCLLVVLFSAAAFGQTNYWEPTSSFADTEIRNLITNGNIIFATTMGEGIFRSSDQGDTWTQVNNGLPNLNVNTIAYTSNNILYTGGEFDSLYRSTDNGNSWEGVQAFPLANNTAYIYINNNNHLFVSVAAGQLWRSTDDGQTWLYIADPAWSVSTPWSMTTNTSTGTLFTGTGGGYAYRSFDNGDNWEPLNNNNGLTDMFIRYLAVNTNGDIFAGTNSGFFLSTDNGDSWSRMINAPPTIRGLVINSVDDIFAGDFSLGVRKSTDNGANWTVLNSGLTELSIRSLALNSEQRLFAGTSSGSVFRSSGITGLEDNLSELPSRYDLKQNYPNPFNPATIIKY